MKPQSRGKRGPCERGSLETSDCEGLGVLQEATAPENGLQAALRTDAPWFHVQAATHSRRVDFTAGTCNCIKAQACPAPPSLERTPLEPRPETLLWWVGDSEMASPALLLECCLHAPGTVWSEKLKIKVPNGFHQHQRGFPRKVTLRTAERKSGPFARAWPRGHLRITHLGVSQAREPQRYG